MEFFVQSTDEQQIFVRQYGKNASNAVVVVHGLSEHGGRYDNFAKILAKHNFLVFAMDFRGHGKSGNKKGDVKSLKQLLQDLECVVNFVKQNKNVKKIGLFGHSAGGGISALFAAKHKIDFLILSSPVVYTPKKLKVLRILPYKILPLKVRKKVSESSDMLKKSYSDPLSTNVFSLETVGVLLEEIPRKLRRARENIDCPLLLLFGKQDTLLNEPHYFYEFFSNVKSQKKQIVGFENTNHRIVNNKGSVDRINLILKWLNKILG